MSFATATLNLQKRSLACRERDTLPTMVYGQPLRIRTCHPQNREGSPNQTPGDALKGSVGFEPWNPSPVPSTNKVRQGLLIYKREVNFQRYIVLVSLVIFLKVNSKHEFKTSFGVFSLFYVCSVSPSFINYACSNF